jgi:hypothetical protein
MYEEWWVTLMCLLLFSAMVRACMYYRATSQMRYVYIQQQAQDPAVVPIMVQPGYVYGAPPSSAQQAQGYPFAQSGACYQSSQPVVGVPVN